MDQDGGRTRDCGVRSYAPDLPLGSHTIALGSAADQSPRGIARQVIALIEALELENVTLVGNDTGGAICQFLLDSDASRIGRVVLTNCDAFTHFPPAPFGLLVKACRSPSAIRVLVAPMRATAIRHSPLGTGCSSVSRSTPTRHARGSSRACATRPFAKTWRASPSRSTPRISTSRRIGSAASTDRRCWCGAPPTASSKLQDAHRLRDTFTNARLVEIANGRTFVPLDEPTRLATEIGAFQPG